MALPSMNQCKNTPFHAATTATFNIEKASLFLHMEYVVVQLNCLRKTAKNTQNGRDIRHIWEVCSWAATLIRNIQNRLGGAV